MDNKAEIIKVKSLQNLLIARATGDDDNHPEYEQLRAILIKRADIKKLLPEYVLNCRTLKEFWQFIKYEYAKYEERRNFIWKSFQPLLDQLELNDSVPSDQVVSNIVQKIDSVHIHNIWQKALERRATDSEGAITLARTLLESTCKYILDEHKVEYGNAPDINQLYRLVSKELNLSPSQHTEQTFKQILGGCSAIVEGLGSLRNRVGDAHGQGKVSFKPSARHAELAVNLAGAMAVFLFSTWDMKQNNIKSESH